MAVKRDYYEVLGLSTTASADEIKSAYRRLARQHHPDVNQGDSAAEARFKEINEAYEVLSNQEKRQRYDQFGHAGVNGQPGFSDSGFGGFGVGDIFDMYTQLHPLHSTARTGLGIGLTLVKQLVAMHGGSIEARSAGEGAHRVCATRNPDPGGTAVKVTSCPGVAASARSCESARLAPSSRVHAPFEPL